MNTQPNPTNQPNPQNATPDRPNNGQINTVNFAASVCHQDGTAVKNTVAMHVGLRHTENGAINHQVYVVICDELKRVKFGMSRRGTKRALIIAGDCPYPARVLAVIWTPYANAVEAKIHSDLEQKRRHSEWFEMTSEEVMNYLKTNGLLDDGDLSLWAVRFCECCGREISTNKTTTAKYCSRSCRTMAYKKRNVTSTNRKRHKPKSINKLPNVNLTSTCEHCGAEMPVKRNTGPKRKRFCSTACRVAAHRARHEVSHE